MRHVAAWLVLLLDARRRPLESVLGMLCFGSGILTPARMLFEAEVFGRAAIALPLFLRLPAPCSIPFRPGPRPLPPSLPPTIATPPVGFPAGLLRPPAGVLVRPVVLQLISTKVQPAGRWKDARLAGLCACWCRVLAGAHGHRAGRACCFWARGFSKSFSLQRSCNSGPGGCRGILQFLGQVLNEILQFRILLHVAFTLASKQHIVQDLSLNL